MKIKGAFTIFLALFAVLLVACAKGPEAAGPGIPSEPAAGSTAAGEAGAAMEDKPVAPEAQFKITTQTAMKNPSRVMFVLENIGNVDSSVEVTVGLVYARKVVSTKTETVSLNKGESKEVIVEFPDVASFTSYTIEGAGITNPVRPATS